MQLMVAYTSNLECVAARTSSGKWWCLMSGSCVIGGDPLSGAEGLQLLYYGEDGKDVELVALSRNVMN